MLVSAFLQGPLHVLYPAWRDRRGRMEFELDNGVFPISWTTWISERWCPSLGGHCPLWNKTAFPSDQAVSITALSGRLKSESLLGLWKRRKKYTNEKIHVRIRHPPPFLTNKKNVLQLLSFKKKKIKNYSRILMKPEKSTAWGYQRPTFPGTAVSPSPYGPSASLCMWLTVPTAWGRVRLYELPLQSPQPGIAWMSSATSIDL